MSVAPASSKSRGNDATALNRRIRMSSAGKFVLSPPRVQRRVLTTCVLEHHSCSK